MEAKNNELIDKNHKLTDIIHEQDNKLSQLKAENDQLLRYTELSKSDIKQACEKDKMIASMTRILRVMG